MEFCILFFGQTKNLFDKGENENEGQDDGEVEGDDGSEGDVRIFSEDA